MLMYEGQTIKLTDECGNIYNVKQVTKPTARKAYDSGKPVWIHPCNLRLDNMWQKPMPTRNGYGLTFDNAVNSFKVFNCNAYNGKRVIYFIPAA